jgi:hypothetical protein
MVVWYVGTVYPNRLFDVATGEAGVSPSCPGVLSWPVLAVATPLAVAASPAATAPTMSPRRVMPAALL